MKVYNFEKEGVRFSLRNPKWEKDGLNLEWKIIGIKENTKNDGYYYHGVFNPVKKAIIFPAGAIINGQQVEGVILPDNVLKQIELIYQELKEKALIEKQKKLYADVKYTLNDTDAYGIYNGISEFDIMDIVMDIQKQLNSNVFVSSKYVATILNKDEELKQIAQETYQPYPEQKNWNDEYRIWFRQAAKEKKAPGYGMIPNKIIREKIRDIIIKEIDKENKRKAEEQDRVNHLFEIAKKTGEKQLIRKWTEDCDDLNIECSVDVCCLWAMPDGSKKVTRTHTY